MSEQRVTETSGKNRVIFGLWAIALGVFFIFLVMVLFRAPELRSPEQQPLASTLAQLAKTDNTSLTASLKERVFIYDKLPPLGSVENPLLPFAADNKFILVGAGLQGFYQTVGAEQAWSLNMPAYRVDVQLLQRQAFPKLVKDKVKVEWAAHTTANDAKALEKIAPALLQGELRYNEQHSAFSADLPAEALDVLSQSNPYPVIAIKAHAEDTGELLAETAITIGISPGFSCASCHGDPQYGVLQVHDARNGTKLEKDARAGKTVSCYTCHSGIQTQDGQLVSAGKVLGLSAAVHGWHAPYLADMGEDACLNCHIGMGRSNDQTEDVRRMFMRDLHAQRGVSCVSCHGDLEDHALALLQAEKKAGQAMAERSMERFAPVSVDNAEAIVARVPWVQEPDCLSCHDFMKKPDLKSASAFNKWTDRVGDYDALFSVRTDGTGTVRCISCHGAPHAIYPAKNPVGGERDNLQPLQYQQDARVLGGEDNCAMCHTQAMNNPKHHKIVKRSFTLIHVPEGANLGMPKVRFSHDAHKTEDCMTCHHKGHEDGKALFCTSSGCHDAVLTNPGDPASDYRYFRNAFHGVKNSCNSCHLERERLLEAGGPTNCQGCHRAPSKMWKTTVQ